ncbi:MAG: dihydrofolate reductase [Bdellovibrionaceae bacterium]|nr:dihydrofolate reductase [Pseudobdellovibrionaceae bacterium]
MILSLVAAMAKNRTIGKDNTLIWHLPEDLEFFKTTTKNKIMVMGRKTFDSLPKVLPGRFHIVISRTLSPSTHERVHFVTSVDQAIAKSSELIAQGWDKEVCIIGGAEIYKLFIPLANRIYLTELNRNFDGDTFFPEFDKSQFRDELLKHSSEGDIDMDFKLYSRK